MADIDLARSDYPENIEDIMHSAYLQYSLSVNVGRAIPDVRDGMKPGMRRILFAMRQLGLYHNRPYVKCAKVVGEVIGNYHPHGDQAVYDTLVRMAQEFAMRNPLVDGQGNFGSIDGDAAAAYRYTECRLQRIAEELLTDIDKDTVDMAETFDTKSMEPVVLPARFPNLLVNGTTGIGVGMATNIPPHNLGEVIDATIHLIDAPHASIKDLMQFIKGPDFPTGASIVGVGPLVELYETGHGIITVRAKAAIEETATGGERIVVTEIPYALNKENLITKIADLVRNKVVPGIASLNDESSSRNGIRIAIDVKRNEMATVVLNQLYKHSQLQTSFGAQLLVVDRNRPVVMNLRQVLLAYIDHRFEVITRRTQYELNQAEAKAHVLEGLIIAVDNIDEVIAIIRASRTRDEAAATLMERFGLSKRQTTAILEMRLQALTGLARDELKAEYDAIMTRIAYLRDLLASREKLMGVVKDELLEVREKHADNRRTDITVGENEINIEDLIQRGVCAVTVTDTNYIKRQPVETFRVQHRGGKGVIGMQTKEQDYVRYLFTACTHDYLLFFTNTGQMRWLKVYEIPEGSRTGKGKAIVNLLDLQPDEQIRAMVTVDDIDQEDKFLLFATRNGVVKKTPINAFRSLRRVGIKAIVLDDDDDLIDVQLVDDSQDVMLFTQTGMACRFESTRVRSMGRASRGVIGVRMGQGDSAVSMQVVDKSDDILLITANGLGKRSNIGSGIAGDGYRLTNRGSKGVIGIQLRGEDAVVGAARVEPGDEMLITTTAGLVVRISTDEIRPLGRSTQGVKIIDLRADDAVASTSLIHRLEEEPQDEEPDADHHNPHPAEHANAESDATEAPETPAESADSAELDDQ